MGHSSVMASLHWVVHETWVVILLLVAGFSWLNFLEHEYRASLITFISVVFLIQGCIGGHLVWRRLRKKLQHLPTVTDSEG